MDDRQDGPRRTRSRIVAALARRVQRGDASALRPLVDALQPTLLRDARRILRDRASAEDAFIVAMKKVLDRLDEIEPEYLLPYARRSVKNAALDLAQARHKRDAARALRDTDILEGGWVPGAGRFVEKLPDDSRGPEEDAEARRRRDRIRGAVERLKEPGRTAVRRYYLDDWAMLDVADELGVTPSAVKRLLRAARVTLGARLRGLEVEP